MRLRGPYSRRSRQQIADAAPERGSAGAQHDDRGAGRQSPDHRGHASPPRAPEPSQNTARSPDRPPRAAAIALVRPGSRVRRRSRDSSSPSRCRTRRSLAKWRPSLMTTAASMPARRRVELLLGQCRRDDRQASRRAATSGIAGSRGAGGHRRHAGHDRRPVTRSERGQQPGEAAVEAAGRPGTDTATSSPARAPLRSAPPRRHRSPRRRPGPHRKADRDLALRRVEPLGDDAAREAVALSGAG